MSSDKARAYFSRNADFKAGLDADEAEFRAVIMGTASLEEGARDERWTGEIEEDLPGTRAAWIEREDALEQLGGDIAAEIERRTLIMGESYPFVWKDAHLTHRPSVSKVYEFCLAITMAPSLSQGVLKGLSIAFERLARDVLRLHTGPTSRGVRTGWPRQPADQLPTRAQAVFKRLEELTGEWLWQPRQTRPEDPSSTFEKDQGLDVVVWRELPDKRIGQLFLLAQCACGTTDWEGKWHDLDLDTLRIWLNPTTFTPPVRCFCVPFHIGNTAKLEDVSRRAGLTLDRARIALLAESDPSFIAREAVEPYEKWIGVVADAQMSSKPATNRRSRGRRP